MAVSAVQETLDSLKIILEDEPTFLLVVDKVFDDLDINHNGSLDLAEFTRYVGRCCASMGIRDVPSADQVMHVFKHLDLDNDKCVTKGEMAVFLRHLFREQLKACSEKLRVKPSHRGPGAAHAGAAHAGAAHAGAAHAGAQAK